MDPAAFDRLSRTLALGSDRRTVLRAMAGLAGLLPGHSTSNPSGGPGMLLPGARPASQLCTLVELRPGYPGYRGFVTGLYGAGEVACLEELTTLYPWFDQATEDAENAAAAARLGLAGDPSVWVWENWLAIEAERGLAPACYLAAFQQMTAGGFTPAPIGEGDSRLLIGAIGGQEFVWRVAGQAGGRFADDYLLRAVGWAYSGLVHPTAWDILAGAEAAVQAMTTPGGGMPYIIERVRLQGGYAPVPASACPEDQIFLAAVTMQTLVLSDSGPVGAAFLNAFDSEALNWMAAIATGSTNSFREHLIEHFAGLP